MKLLIDITILLRSSKTFLQHPAKSKPHPLDKKAESPSLHDIRQNPGAKNLPVETISIIQQSSRRSTIKRYDNYIGKCFVVKGVLNPFKIFRSAHWIPNQNFWIRSWVIISRHSKISPIICSRYGQWDILWETSACSAFYERYIRYEKFVILLFLLSVQRPNCEVIKY